MNALQYTRSPSLLSRHDTRMLFIDIQTKLVPLVDEHTSLIVNCGDLLQTAELLGVPVVATEQYPSGLGETVPVLRDRLPQRIEKRRFSAAESLDWRLEDQAGNSRKHVVVAGIEAHVCVLQTVLDLLSDGFDVHVPVDAVSSRSPTDCATAIQRMRDMGGVITTTETVMFELCETSEATEFRELSRLIRARDDR